MTDVKISRGARRPAIGLLVRTLITGAANLWASYLQVQASQRKWCAVLVTLDNADQAALRAPPAQRPKGAYSLALITDFRNLRQEFCGSGR